MTSLIASGESIFDFSVWVVWGLQIIGIVVIAAILLGYAAGWSKSPSTKYLFINCNPIFRMFVTAYHLFRDLLGIEVDKESGLYRLCDTEDEVKLCLERAHIWLWHYSVAFPVIVVLGVAWCLDVEWEERLLFSCIALGTVSLEVCISVLTHKADFINNLARQNRRAFKIEDNEVRMEVIKELHQKHLDARTEMAKAALVTGFSLVLFSSLVVAEARRMKEATVPDEDVIGASLRSAFASFQENAKAKPSKAMEQEIFELLDSQSYVKEFSNALREEKAKKSSKLMIVSIVCAVAMLLIAGTKLWVSTRHVAHKEDFIDEYLEEMEKSKKAQQANGGGGGNP